MKTEENLKKIDQKIAKVKNKGGRPSKYRPIFAKRLNEYCNKPPYTEQESIIVDKKGITINKKTRVPNDLPTLEEFALLNGISSETCVNWANDINKNGKPRYPEFLTAYKKLKDTQKRFLVVNGLRGYYKENYSIFVSQNFTDMRDKIEHSGDQERPLVVKSIDFSNVPDDATKPPKRDNTSV